MAIFNYGKKQTIETALSVTDFINTVADEVKRTDSFQLVELFKSASGFEPKMWGPAIVGFGCYHYKYESGREGDAPLAAFSPRKDSISLYVHADDAGKAALFKLPGKQKQGKGCIHIKNLNDIHTGVLHDMIAQAVIYMKKLYPDG